MAEPRIGDRVVTGHGEGIVDTITAGNADAAVLRYRVTSTHRRHRRWYYLDELILIADETDISR